MAWLIRLGNRRFLLFTLLLLLKCCLAWLVVFEDGPSWSTMLTEVPFFWIVFCLIEWFSVKRKLLYYTIANLLFTLLYFTVLMYYKYYGIIVTYHALSQANKVTKVGNSTYSLMDPYYLLVFFDIAVLIAIPLWLRRNGVRKIHRQLRPISKTVLTALFLVSVSLSYFSIWPNRASMNENKQAEEMGILNYEMYTILEGAADEAETIDMENITQPAIDSLKEVRPTSPSIYHAAGKGRNVILVQMESFQQFLLGLRVNGQEVTPNLNRLAQKSLSFNRFYAMVGQGTTSDAEYVVNTSLYVPKHEAATQNNVKKELPSLPKLFKNAGYTTATFHTNAVEFWNRRELYAALGWGQFYDRSYFGDNDHVAFGASDEILYIKTAEELRRIADTGKPFYAQVISMSAHHPYNIPESKLRLELPEELENKLLGRYIQAQNYADFAIGTFISELEQSGLVDNSVLLFYGDHQGLPIYSLSKEEQAMLGEMIGHDYGYTDMFKVPFLLYAPGIANPSEFDEIGGQIDVLPTIADFMGLPFEEQIHFGQSLLESRNNLLPMRHFLPSGSLVEDEVLFVPGKAFEDGTHYPFSSGEKRTEGQAEERATKQDYDRALELLNFSDSYVKQLPDRNADQPD